MATTGVYAFTYDLDLDPALGWSGCDQRMERGGERDAYRCKEKDNRTNEIFIILRIVVFCSGRVFSRESAITLQGAGRAVTRRLYEKPKVLTMTTKQVKIEVEKEAARAQKRKQKTAYMQLQDVFMGGSPRREKDRMEKGIYAGVPMQRKDGNRMKTLLFILSFLLFAATAEAATYWLAPSGTATCAQVNSVSDPGVYRKLVDGLSCLTQPGDTMMLKPGNYLPSDDNSLPYPHTFVSGTLANYTKIRCQIPKQCIFVSDGFDSTMMQWNTLTCITSNSTAWCLEAKFFAAPLSK